MNKEWISGADGHNLKFKRETLLNYGMNRWGLNKAYSVGKTSELIRACAPRTFDEWESFYFSKACENKKNGLKITKEYITGLGQKLYIKLSEVVRSELDAITEDECIDYAYNLVLNRTFEGYKTEIDTVYGQLEAILKQKIEPAPDEWDRRYGVDFYITIKDKNIGIQIKPISSDNAINQYQWVEMHRRNHQKFYEDFGGHVFFVYSVKGSGKKKKIHNLEIIDQIIDEINRLSSTSNNMK